MNSYKTKVTFLNEGKINTLVSKFLTTVTENHKESKKTVHRKLKEYTIQKNSIQEISGINSMFLLNKSLKQSPLILTKSLVDSHKPEYQSVFCH